MHHAGMILFFSVLSNLMPTYVRTYINKNQNRKTKEKGMVELHINYTQYCYYR